MGLPTALACDVGVVEGAPVAVTFGARTDGKGNVKGSKGLIIIWTKGFLGVWPFKKSDSCFFLI